MMLAGPLSSASPTPTQGRRVYDLAVRPQLAIHAWCSVRDSTPSRSPTRWFRPAFKPVPAEDLIADEESRAPCAFDLWYVLLLCGGGWYCYSGPGDDGTLS